MVIEIEKEYTIDSRIDKVWDLIKNINEIASCIPGLEGMQIVNETSIKAKIKPAFSFVKGKFDVESEIKEMNERESLMLEIKGSSIGSSFKISLLINTYPEGNNTKVKVKIEAETYGLLKAIPKSLTYEVIDEIEKSMLSCIKEKLKNL